MNWQGCIIWPGEIQGSEELYKKSLQIEERVLGEEHTDTQDVYENMEIVYYKSNPKGNFEQWLEERMEGGIGYDE